MMRFSTWDSHLSLTTMEKQIGFGWHLKLRNVFHYGAVCGYLEEVD